MSPDLPRRISRLVNEWDQAGGPALQAEVDAVRKIVQGFPMIAALKEVLAVGLDDDAWRRVRAPLNGLSEAQSVALHRGLNEAGFVL